MKTIHTAVLLMTMLTGCGQPPHTQQAPTQDDSATTMPISEEQVAARIADMMEQDAMQQRMQWETILKEQATDSTQVEQIAEWAEDYLSDPNSPLRNEDCFIIFLECLLHHPQLTEAQTSRPTYQLEMAQKNRPGTIATNFTYRSRDGKPHTLHQLSSPLTLLVFYSPDCTHCQQILNLVYASEWTHVPTLKVLAVYTEGDHALWQRTQDDMPADWIVGIDESEIVQNKLYDLPAMPVMYLLDADKRVILKDPNPQTLELALASMQAKP